jgi:hypothetical protein
VCVSVCESVCEAISSGKIELCLLVLCICRGADKSWLSVFHPNSLYQLRNCEALNRCRTVVL